MHASPPSLAVELAGPERARAAAFERNPDSRPRVQQPAFAWHAEGRQAVDGGGHASVQARMIAVPWWFIVVLGLPLPLLWLRRKVGGVRQGEPRGSANWRNA